MDPDIVIEALRESLCRRLPTERHGDLLVEPGQNLLELVDSFGFAELILELESELDVELPLKDVDLASIVHADRLISFVCHNG